MLSFRAFVSRSFLQALKSRPQSFVVELLVFAFIELSATFVESLNELSFFYRKPRIIQDYVQGFFGIHVHN